MNQKHKKILDIVLDKIKRDRQGLREAYKSYSLKADSERCLRIIYQENFLTKMINFIEDLRRGADESEA